MDSIYFRFLIAALATWRVSFSLVRECGPWNIFLALRDKAGLAFLGRLLGCVKCTGVWVAIPLAFFVKGSWLELVVGVGRSNRIARRVDTATVRMARD
jgi:hypothetical protein